MIKKVDHFVITTANPDILVAFYEKIGFTTKKSKGRYEVYAGDFKINIHIKDFELSPHAKNIAIGSADFCLEIDEDINTFMQHLLDNGISIEEGIVERYGVKGNMKSIYLRDPDQNLIEFCSYE